MSESTATTTTNQAAKTKAASATSSTNKSASGKADNTTAAKPAQPNGTTATANSQSTTEEPTTQRCKHCGEQKPKEGFSQHSKACLRAKKERQERERQAKEAAAAAAAAGVSKDNDGDSNMEDAANTKGNEESGNVNKDSASASNNNKKTSKKRKADGLDTPTNEKEQAATKPPPKKQKKKDESAAPKPSKPAAGGTGGGGGGGGSKPKGPVDVERQCGVLLPNGAMCARSLTCKSHAMGAKRSVPGRSLPYDILLAQYQKKNQAKQQKAALASNNALPDEALDAQTGTIDSDEERDAVISAVARALPRPTWNQPVVSVMARTKQIRLKDVLANALGGTRGAGLFSTNASTPGGGRGNIFTSNATATPATAATSGTDGTDSSTSNTAATNATGQQQRKASASGSGDATMSGALNVPIASNATAIAVSPTV